MSHSLCMCRLCPELSHALRRAVNPPISQLLESHSVKCYWHSNPSVYHLLCLPDSFSPMPNYCDNGCQGASLFVSRSSHTSVVKGSNCFCSCSCVSPKFTPGIAHLSEHVLFGSDAVVCTPNHSSWSCDRHVTSSAWMA